MRPAFLYVNAGKGHYIPAKALYDTYLDGYGDDAILANLFDIISSSYMQRIIQDSWRHSLRHTAGEAYTYPMLDNPVNRFLLRHIINNSKHVRALKAWIEREKPDFILSTNFIGGLILPNAIERLGYRIPVFQYAADCVATPRAGVNNKLTYMYLATEMGIRNAIRSGMREDKVKLCPFPLQYKIENSRRLTRKEAREKLALDDIFTIAFSLGGEGICRLNVIKEIDERGLDIQFILLGSMQESTKEDLNRILKDIHHVRIISPGFVDNVNEYIEASDMTMGKAGANSVMESIYLKRFTLVSDQLYPFEGSKTLLEDLGIGMVENDIRRQADIIENFYQHPDEIESENFEKTGITFSSRNFIEMLLSDYDKAKNCL